MLAEFWPSNGQKTNKIGWKCFFFDHHRLSYPLNSIDSWCPHLFGESSEMNFWCIGLIYPLCWPSLYFHYLWLSLRLGRASSDALFLACSRACASKVFSLRADCGRVIVYPGLKQWERPRHNIFGVCTRLAGGVCMSTSANSSASKHLTVTKIVWKIVYVTFDYLISHFFKILSLEFMANLFRDFRASVSLKVFHYRLRGKWCQYDLEHVEINC